MYESGAFGSDGWLYIIPKNSTHVSRFDPATEVWETLGESFPEGGNKWVGAAVSTVDGCIYAFPGECKIVSRVLQIDPRKGTTRMVGDSVLEHAAGVTSWPWQGTVAAADGCIYGIPRDATSVLRFDPRTQKLSTFGDIPDDNGSYRKYWGGILGQAGRFIYCPPSNAARVLCIDTKTQTCELIGADLDSTKPGKWHGGALGGDGAIYCMPLVMNRVLRIDPLTKTVSLHGPTFRFPAAVIGAAAGTGGFIYGTPHHSDRVLQIDPVGTVSRVGTAIPKELTSKLADAVLGPDGSVWCLPFNLPSRLLKITPPSTLPPLEPLRALVSNPGALQRCLSLDSLRSVFVRMLLLSASGATQSRLNCPKSIAQQLQQQRPEVFAALGTSRALPLELQDRVDFLACFAASSATRLAPAPNAWKPLPSSVDDWSWPPLPLIPLRAACKIVLAGPAADVETAWPVLSHAIAGLLVTIVDAVRTDYGSATKLLRDVYKLERLRSLETYRKQLQRARRDPTYPEFKAVAERLSAECQKRNRKKLRVQSISFFPQLYAAAHKLQSRFHDFLRELSRRCARSTWLPAPLKGIGRALEKLVLCPGTPAKIKEKGASVLDTRSLVDVLRGSLKCPDFTEITYVLELLQQLDVEMGDAQKAKAAGIDLEKFQVYVVHIKNRFTNPTSGGWADCMVNFRFAHGDDTHHVMELQLQHEQMLVVRKEGKAHKQYNSFRSAFELLETVGEAPDDRFEEAEEDTPPLERLQLQLNNLMRHIHATHQINRKTDKLAIPKPPTEELEMFAGRIDKCEAQNLVLKEEKQSLQNQLTEYEILYKSLLSRVDKCDSDNRALLSRLEKTERVNQDLMSRLEKTERDNQDLKCRLEKTESDSRALFSELSDTRALFSNLDLPSSRKITSMNEPPTGEI